jgi:hypothetical protein
MILSIARLLFLYVQDTRKQAHAGMTAELATASPAGPAAGTLAVPVKVPLHSTGDDPASPRCSARTHAQ